MDNAGNQNYIENEKNIKTFYIPHGEEKSYKHKETINSKEKAMKQLEDGIKAVLDSESFANWCEKQGSLYYNRYSFRNSILVYTQNKNATYVRSYEAWKKYGRQVKQGATGIYIIAPVFVEEYKGKGSLFNSIENACVKQLKEKPELEYATFRLAETGLSFNRYKNGLYDVVVNGNVAQAHVTQENLKKFLENSVIGKVPAYYNVNVVFDVEDTTDKVEYLWVKQYKKEELALDENGKPVKNNRGQYRIYNTEERKARFNESSINMRLEENDSEKMKLLYDSLVAISERAGIKIYEINIKEDEFLSDGALGYYNKKENKIVIAENLNQTEKVSVLFHEMAHSRMHKDLEALKDTLEKMNQEEVEITQNLKEMQAEAVAYMTASNFGIKTEHKSFGYIASWSNGRELKELSQSLEYIYNESKKLMTDIEKELDGRGLTLKLEPKYTTLTDKEKNEIISEVESKVINEVRINQDTISKLKVDLQNLYDTQLGKTVKEQLMLACQNENIFNTIQDTIKKFKAASAGKEQKYYQSQIESLLKNSNNCNEKMLGLQEYMQGQTPIKKKEKININELYKVSPLEALQKLKTEIPSMQKLTDNELKYIADSSYIRKIYAKYLGIDNLRFATGALTQLEKIKNVMSKNKVAIEIYDCEKWTRNEIFREGQVLHPKTANDIVKKNEKEVRLLKEKAEKKDEYFPYNKCIMDIYFIDNTGKLNTFYTRIDIGDGEQEDITSHLKEFKIFNKMTELIEKFSVALKERNYIPMEYADSEFPDNKNTNEVQKLENKSEKSMENWKNTIRNYMEEKQQQESAMETEKTEINEIDKNGAERNV